MTLLHLAPAERTLPQLLERQAAAQPDRLLLKDESRSLTYTDAVNAAASMAHHLLAAGVRPGDRVAVMARNRVEIIEAWLGCSWTGAILVPVNAALRGAPLQHVLEDADPRILVVEHDLLRSLDRIDRIPTALEQLWLLDGDTASRFNEVTVSAMPDARYPGDRMPAVHAEPGDISAILYTSGTTGPAKGVCCPQAQFYWWGINTARVLRLTSDDVLYSCLPLFHMNALNTFLQALVSGSTYIIGPHFSASRFWSRLTDAEATVTYILGAMASILARRDNGPHDRTHHVRAALAPATPPELLAAFHSRFGVELIDGHGMTETNLVIGPRDGRSRPGFMGRVMEGFHARVVDEQDAPVSDGTPGELVMRADEPFAFAVGYWSAPEATLASTGNLWFHSGDRVVREADGFFRFVDRIKDIIRRRGENVSAWEVEQAILSHPDIAVTAAYPVPSEIGDDEVMVSIVPRSGAAVEPLDIIRHCEQHLPYFAVPRYVEFAEELPLTENGKIKKPILRERGIGPHTWDREAAGYEIER